MVLSVLDWYEFMNPAYLWLYAFVGCHVTEVFVTSDSDHSFIKSKMKRGDKSLLWGCTLPICDSERKKLEMSTIMAMQSKGCLQFYNHGSVGVSFRAIHEPHESLAL